MNDNFSDEDVQVLKKIIEEYRHKEIINRIKSMSKHVRHSSCLEPDDRYKYYFVEDVETIYFYDLKTKIFYKIMDC